MYRFWFCLGLLVITGLVVRVVISRRRRTRTLLSLATELHLSFSPEDLIDVQDRYHNLDMIRRGHSRHACNILYGRADAGLVTVFCYHYDLGFGAHQVSRDWWFAVLETPGVHKHWRAVPAGASTLTSPVRIDVFDLQADHRDTLSQLTDAGIERVLEAAPADYHWEVRGPLVAVATPFDPAPETPRRLLITACDLARILAHALPGQREAKPAASGANESGR